MLYIQCTHTKAPTVLWTSPDGSFRGFGLDALEGYSQNVFHDREQRCVNLLIEDPRLSHPS